MNVEIFKRENEIIAIPLDKIVSIRWFGDSLLLYIETKAMSHYFSFDTEKEGRLRFDSIIDHIEAYN